MENLKDKLFERGFVLVRRQVYESVSGQVWRQVHRKVSRQVLEQVFEQVKEPLTDTVNNSGGTLI